MKENNENIERYSTQAKELLNLKIITKDEYEERIQDYTDYTNSEGKYSRKQQHYLNTYSI